MVVSVLHMIFEFLAFKNDVAFFSSTSTEALNKYISIQSIVGGIFCQIILSKTTRAYITISSSADPHADSSISYHFDQSADNMHVCMGGCVCLCVYSAIFMGRGGQSAGHGYFALCDLN
jgi:hypothetical protein